MNIFKRREKQSADTLLTKQAIYFKVDSPFMTSLKIGMGITLGMVFVGVILVLIGGAVTFRTYDATEQSPIWTPENNNGELYIFP